MAPKKRKRESSSAAMRRNVAMVINDAPTHGKTTSKLAVWRVRYAHPCHCATIVFPTLGLGGVLARTQPMKERPMFGRV